jgi:hypothetical protein
MLTSLGEGNFFQGNVFLALSAVGVATPIHGWMLLLVRQMRSVPLDWAGTTLHVILPELLLNIVLASVVYPLLHRVVQRLGGDRLEW